MPPRVLVVGLDPYRVPGPWDPEPVSEAIRAGMAGLAERGFDARSCLVGLDGSEDVEATVAAALVTGPWDAVLVGGGLRTEETLEVFEAVLNLVHRLAPAAAIALNSRPDDLATAVERALAR
ncbi:hypothetical protein [Nocardioides sp.]|uniref:hypothetical protein n=1 Tax=Nocardioides sp. TaxID=35761 RepID=UPI003527D17A